MILAVAKQTEPEWQAIHRVADRLEPSLRRAFLNAIERIRDAIPLDELTEAIETRSIERILSAITPQLPPEAVDEIRGVFSQALEQSAKVADDFAGFDLRFDLVNERAVRWAQQHAAELVTLIDSETRQAIRDIVVRGIVEGIPPRAQAREIRRLVGLTQGHARAVDNFWRGLIDQGIDEAFADRQADRMARRLLRWRSENIARTEIIRASNAGQQLLWQTAADENLIDPTITRRIWIATADDRTCDRCLSLDGETVEFVGQFTEAAETAPKGLPVTVQFPPLHPSCRCATGLVFDEAPVPPGEFTSREDAEAWLRSLGIKDVDLEGITRVESLNDLGRAVDLVRERYPWVAERFGTSQGLNRVVTNTERLRHFGAGAQVRGTRQGLELSLRPDVFNDSLILSVTAADSTHYGTVLHELGHVVQLTLAPRGRALTPFQAHTAPGGPWSGLTNGRRAFLREVSMYADESGAEFFAEMFQIKNGPGYRGHLEQAYWRRAAPPEAAVRRLERAEQWIEDFWSGWADHRGIDPGDIL